MTASRLRLQSLGGQLRASLFFVPMLAVISAVALGLLGIALDRWLVTESIRLPFVLASTVESARALLSTVAGATITFAGIAFSVSLLVLQLASSQYSPRVVHTLFRDPFNKRVMALVVGTFVYCLMVLRSVRSALEEGGDPVIPNLSVAVALLLGIATILAIVAFIDHSAHSMDVSEILEGVRRESVRHIRREWAVAEPGVRPTDPSDKPVGPGRPIRFDRTGWVERIDFDAVVECVPDGGLLQLGMYPGRYAIEGTTMGTISPPPPDPEQFDRRIRAAVAVGETRTMHQDVSYGLRQLVDVALKALSPGINDPTTAQDAIFHAAAVLAELLRRDPPPRWRVGTGGGRLVLTQQRTHDELIETAFEEIRRAAAGAPAVCIYILEALDLLQDALEADGLADRTGALTAQARLVVAGCRMADVLAADVRLVEKAYRERFGPL